MLLRRITEHVKDQNWFAILIDFVIVVAGILIAFQITEWNETRSKRNDFDHLIAGLDSEVSENLVRLSIAEEYDLNQLDDLLELRQLVANPDQPASDEQLGNLLWKLIPVHAIHIKRNMLDEFLSSDLVDLGNQRTLFEAASGWDETIALSNRSDEDILSFRNHILNPYIANNLPAASILRYDNRRKRLIAPSLTPFSRTELAEDVVLESLIAARLQQISQDLEKIESLEEKAKLLRRIIKEERA